MKHETKPASKHQNFLRTQTRYQLLKSALTNKLQAPNVIYQNEINSLLNAYNWVIRFMFEYRVVG